MNVKSPALASAIALVALAATPNAHAGSGGPTAAVDACVKSFVDSYLPDRSVRQVQKKLSTSGPLAVFWGDRDYTIVLSARGADSGTLIAEARCVANGKGIVVVLDNAVAARDKARADFIVAVR